MPRMNVRYSSSGWVVKYANFGENQTFGHQFRPFSDQFSQKSPNSDQVRPIRTIIGGTGIWSFISVFLIRIQFPSTFSKACLFYVVILQLKIAVEVFAKLFIGFSDFFWFFQVLQCFTVTWKTAKQVDEKTQGLNSEKLKSELKCWTIDLKWKRLSGMN